jgi:hypothetical protein
MLETGRIGVIVSLRGIDRGDLLSITALHPFIVDEQTSWLDIFPAIGSSELDGEIGHLVRGAEGSGVRVIECDSFVCGEELRLIGG